MSDTFPPDWRPTAAHINALPEPVRSFVHLLETRCDPSGDTRELLLARDTIIALQGLLEETQEALAVAQQELAHLRGARERG